LGCSVRVFTFSYPDNPDMQFLIWSATPEQFRRVMVGLSGNLVLKFPTLILLDHGA